MEDKGIAGDIKAQQPENAMGGSPAEVPVQLPAAKGGLACPHQTMRLNSSQGSPWSNRSQSMIKSSPVFGASCCRYGSPRAGKHLGGLE